MRHIPGPSPRFKPCAPPPLPPTHIPQVSAERPGDIFRAPAQGLSPTCRSLTLFPPTPLRSQRSGVVAAGPQPKVATVRVRFPDGLCLQVGGWVWGVGFRWGRFRRDNTMFCCADGNIQAMRCNCRAPNPLLTSLPPSPSSPAGCPILTSLSPLAFLPCRVPNPLLPFSPRLPPLQSAQSSPLLPFSPRLPPRPAGRVWVMEPVSRIYECVGLFAQPGYHLRAGRAGPADRTPGGDASEGGRAGPQYPPQLQVRAEGLRLLSVTVPREGMRVREAGLAPSTLLNFR